MAHRDKRLMPEGRWALQLAAAIGWRQLRTMKRAGLPVCLHEPFEFLLQRWTPRGDYGPLDRVEALRTELARRDGVVAVFDAVGAHGLPAGAAAHRDEARPLVRSLRETAHVAAVPALWGTFLYLCASASRAQTILELGAGAGFSGCYLASSPTCRRFITVEGSEDRARLAQVHLRQVVGTFELMTAPFETALDSLLPDLHEGLDLVFIDGDKTKGSYLGLLNRLTPRLNPGALLVFDDIQWSGVHDDWKTLCARPGLAYVVNVGRFGVCVWDPNSAGPQAFTLFGLAGIDLYRMRRNFPGPR